MKIGTLEITVIKTSSGLCLTIKGPIYGLETVVTEEDLGRLGAWFSPAPKTDNGVDLETANRIITSGVRALSKKHHPDAGGSNDRMTKLNTVADEIRSRIGG